MSVTRPVTVRRLDAALELDASNPVCSGCSGCGWLPRQPARLPLRLLSGDSMGSAVEPQALLASFDPSALARIVGGLFATLLGVLFVFVAIAQWYGLGGVPTALGACASIAAAAALVGRCRRRLENAIALRLTSSS